MAHDPWGRDAHTALRWAYGLLARSESTPTVFGEWTGGTKRRTDMTMLDHRAQGAIIRKIIDESMADRGPEHSMLVAYYLPHPVKERVAGGGLHLVDRFLPQRRAAIHDVAWWLHGQSAGGYTMLGHTEIVTQFTLNRTGVKRLAKLMEVRVGKAKAAREAAFGLLSDLHERALYVAGAALSRSGLLEPSE